MIQPSLFEQNAYGIGVPQSAKEAGEQAAEACAAKAERNGWNKAAATAFVLAYLEQHGPTPGETLVAAASKLHPAHDARAYGSVLGGLSRAGRIKVVGYCKRELGHGTGGGNIWGLT
jgi:hypothetical protein